MVCFNIKLLLVIFLGLNVLDISFNVSPSYPTTPTCFTHIEPCKILVASRIMPKIIVSCKFVTFDLIIITFMLLQWVLFLSSNNTFVDTRCVNITFMLLQCVIFSSSNNTFVDVRCVNITFMLLQWVLFLSSNNTFVTSIGTILVV